MAETIPELKGSQAKMTVKFGPLQRWVTHCFAFRVRGANEADDQKDEIKVKVGFFAKPLKKGDKLKDANQGETDGLIAADHNVESADFAKPLEVIAAPDKDKDSDGFLRDAHVIPVVSLLVLGIATGRRGSRGVDTTWIGREPLLTTMAGVQILWKKRDRRFSYKDRIKTQSSWGSFLVSAPLSNPWGEIDGAKPIWKFPALYFGVGGTVDGLFPATGHLGVLVGRREFNGVPSKQTSAGYETNHDLLLGFGASLGVSLDVVSLLVKPVGDLK